MIMIAGVIIALIGSVFIQYAIAYSRPNDPIYWFSKEWWRVEAYASVGMAALILGMLLIIMNYGI